MGRRSKERVRKGMQVWKADTVIWGVEWISNNGGDNAPGRHLSPSSETSNHRLIELLAKGKPQLTQTIAKAIAFCKLMVKPYCRRQQHLHTPLNTEKPSWNLARAFTPTHWRALCSLLEGKGKHQPSYKLCNLQYDLSARCVGAILAQMEWE